MDHPPGCQVCGDRAGSEKGFAGYPVVRPERRTSNGAALAFLSHEPDRAAASGDTGTQTDRVYVHQGKRALNVMFLQVYNHTGTHLDTSGHVFEDGVSICDFQPKDLVYERIAVIDLSGLADDTVVMPEHLKPFLEKGLRGRRAAGALRRGELAKVRAGAFFRPLPRFLRAKRGVRALPDAELADDRGGCALHRLYRPSGRNHDRTPRVFLRRHHGQVHHRGRDEAGRRADRHVPYDRIPLAF